MTIFKRKPNNVIALISCVIILLASVSIHPVNTVLAADGLSASPLAEGWYIIQPECARYSALDVSGGNSNAGANVQIWQRNNTASQIFHLSYIGDGYYIITSLLGKVLDGKGAASRSGTNIQTWNFKNGYNQAFKIEKAGSCFYYLKYRQNTNLALDVSGAGSRNGTNVQVYNWSKNNKAQRWTFERMGNFEKNSAVSRVKSTTGSKPISFNIKANGSKSELTLWACNTNYNNRSYVQPSSCALSVRVYSGNKLIINQVLKGKVNTIKIDRKYTNYTVYISKYSQTGKGIIGRTIAGGNNFMNQANYCMISLNNAKIQ